MQPWWSDTLLLCQPLHRTKSVNQIDPNTRLTGLKSLLHIDRETGTIQQLDRDEEIAAPEKKLNFTMFLGVLPVLDLRFLVFVEYVKQPILLEKHELYELAAIAYVPLGS
jgi:hypothetical protein